jgi:hypothetical protein
MARPDADVMGDLFGERGCLGAVVEPDFLLDGDTGGVGKSDAHAPDCAASRAQESHHDTVTGPQLWAANDYHRVGHPRILNPNPTCV